jgi:hypothetical protein
MWKCKNGFLLVQYTFRLILRRLKFLAFSLIPAIVLLALFLGAAALHWRYRERQVREQTPALDSACANGYRQTTGGCWSVGQPRPTRIMLLGGSTTFGWRLESDDDTWASILQKMLCETIPDKHPLVRNFGMCADDFDAEIGRLESEISRKENLPDIVVFFNGFNEIAGTLDNARTARRGGFSSHFLGELATALRSVAVRTRFDFLGNPENRIPDRAISAQARAIAEDYQRDIFRAEEICSTCGIRLLIFLQPTVLTLAPLTGRPEISFVAGLGPLPRLNHAAYSLFRETLATARSAGVKAYDLSHVFDADKKQAFMDVCHMNSHGNEIVAQAIYPHLLDSIVGE